MARTTWLKARIWLIGGIALALLALAVVLIIWAIQYHDYQLALAHYNATWLVARHGYRTPNQIRAEQCRLAECPPANLPLAA